MAVRAETFAEGVPCWTDAMLSDVEAGKRFYGELFGWTFEEVAPGEDSYTTALLDGRPAAGLFLKPDGRLPTVWNLHFATRDAAAAVERVRAAGGNVLMEPAETGRPSRHHGQVVGAVAADPSGAVFGLIQSGVSGGFRVRGEAGAYVWCEVHTRDAAAVDAFYADVFGYGMRDLAELGGGEEDPGFMVWAAAGDPVDEEHAIGGRSLIGETYPAEMPAHFLTYFAVDDCDAAAHTAQRLGGRVLREPQGTPYGRYAVLVDDQGASFAVLTAPDAAPVGTA